MIGFGRWTAALALAIAGLSPALAQEVGEPTSRSFISRYRPQERGTSDTYVVTLSGTGVALPSFPGSNNLSGAFYPSLNYRKSDEPERYSAVDDGISVSILEDPSFRIGPVFRIQPGRYLGDDRLLFGLRKRNFDVEAGVFLEYWPLTFLRARLELRHGFREDSGLVGNVGIDYVESVGRFVFSIGPRLSFGDADYTNRYFGISPQEAFINGRVFPFKADGGLYAAGGLAAITYRWNDSWATTGFVGYDRLVRDAADSPVVTQIGSPNQLTIGAKVSYSFNFTPSRGFFNGFDGR